MSDAVAARFNNVIKNLVYVVAATMIAGLAYTTSAGAQINSAIFDLFNTTPSSGGGGGGFNNAEGIDAAVIEHWPTGGSGSTTTTTTTTTTTDDRGCVRNGIRYTDCGVMTAVDDPDDGGGGGCHAIWGPPCPGDSPTGTTTTTTVTYSAPTCTVANVAGQIGNNINVSVVVRNSNSSSISVSSATLTVNGQNINANVASSSVSAGGSRTYTASVSATEANGYSPDDSYSLSYSIQSNRGSATCSGTLSIDPLFSS